MSDPDGYAVARIWLRHMKPGGPRPPFGDIALGMAVFTSPEEAKAAAMRFDQTHPGSEHRVYELREVGTND